jgi:hypothetical protein
VKAQAGKQMTDAWRRPVARKAAGFNLGVWYERDEINAARNRCIETVRAALGLAAAPQPGR